MGSQTFRTYSRGKSATEAYKNAVDDANYEYGHQEGYSGEINATPGFRDVTKTFKASKLPLEKFIDQRLDKLSKYDGAECICIEEPVTNKNKIKSQVEHFVEKGTKKWILKYVVRNYAGDQVASCDTKGMAVKMARAYTEEHQRTTSIVMEKSLYKSNGLVAKITYKKASNEKEGKWLFYGWASC